MPNSTFTIFADSPKHALSLRHGWHGHEKGRKQKEAQGTATVVSGIFRVIRHGNAVLQFVDAVQAWVGFAHQVARLT